MPRRAAGRSGEPARPGPALRDTPVLLILDNLESLDHAALSALLTAAESWSGCGGSRVLATTRRPEFSDPAWREPVSDAYARLPLTGLGSTRHPRRPKITREIRCWVGNLGVRPKFFTFGGSRP